MKTIVIDPQARAELEESAQWYEQQKEGLGAEFLASITEAVGAIQRLPKAFPHFKNTTIRKFVMRRFPYVIFYEEAAAHVWVYAFAHAKRKPGYWLDRVEGDDADSVK